MQGAGGAWSCRLHAWLVAAPRQRRAGGRARRGAGRRRPRRCRGGARRGGCRPAGRRRSARRRAPRRAPRRRSSARTTSGPRRAGSRGVATVAPSSSSPSSRRSREPLTCASTAGTPASSRMPSAGDARVERGHRRRAGVEAPGASVRGVVGDRHREDVLVGEPAGLRRNEPSVDLRPDPHEAEPGRAEQVLDGAARDDVGAERPHVELDRAAGLVAVGKHERARGVRDLGDRGDVVPMPRAVRERRAADERRALVDRLREPLGARSRRRRPAARARPPRRAAPARARSGRSWGTRTR